MGKMDGNRQESAQKMAKKEKKKEAKKGAKRREQKEIEIAKKKNHINGKEEVK